MQESTKDIEQFYSKLLKDSDLHEFQMLADNPNIFEIPQLCEVFHQHSALCEVSRLRSNKLPALTWKVQTIQVCNCADNINFNDHKLNIV